MYLVFFASLRFRFAEPSRNVTVFALKHSISCENATSWNSDPQKASSNDSLEQRLGMISTEIAQAPKPSLDCRF